MGGRGYRDRYASDGYLDASEHYREMVVDP